MGQVSLSPAYRRVADLFYFCKGVYIALRLFASIAREIGRVHIRDHMIKYNKTKEGGLILFYY